METAVKNYISLPFLDILCMREDKILRKIVAECKCVGFWSQYNFRNTRSAIYKAASSRHISGDVVDHTGPSGIMAR
jgi:hypothetical protein